MFKNNVFISASEERGASNLALRPSEDETQVHPSSGLAPRNLLLYQNTLGLSIQKLTVVLSATF